MDIVIVGHVDHGKSTIVGRLLADTGSLPEGKLEQVKANCERNSKPFEYAFLFDSLRDEQSQGITIDAARIFFKSKLRTYIILDAPGHIEFLKNMVTGASRAEAALLVIDAKEGVRENSRRHGYMLSLLGVKQIAVLVNKMDLLNYDQKAFEKVCDEYRAFLREINVVPICFMPVAGILGENIVHRSDEMSWYNGPTVLEALDSFKAINSSSELPFRMPVQAVYKFTKGGDDRRIVAGTISSGVLKVGQEVVFYPSGKRSSVKSIEGYNRPVMASAQADSATGFTLTEQIFVGRGEIAAVNGEPKPRVATRIRASLFWLGRRPMFKNRTYALKLGTAKTDVRLVEILRVMDTSNLDTFKESDQISTNAVAECVLDFDSPIAVDVAAEFAATGRFVILDRYDISGGGLVREVIDSDAATAKAGAGAQQGSSLVPIAKRSERFGHKPFFVVFLGTGKNDFKELANQLELKLFNAGKNAFFLDSARISPDAMDARYIDSIQSLLDAGVLLLGTYLNPSLEEIETLKKKIGPNRIATIGSGELKDQTDLVVTGKIDEMIKQIDSHLSQRQIIPGR